MNDPSSILRYDPDPIDWGHHDKPAARDRLAATARAAIHRKLEEGAACFQPSEDLVNAINTAIILRSPLLLTGDPGTGKTQVGYYLAKYFGIRVFHYQVHSDSKASDLRYDFDAVAYLRDAYLASSQPGKAQARPVRSSRPPDRAHPRYLHKGKLWQVYEEKDECVLLIDEIDKAPRDFPNDLLQELADYCFEHPFRPGRLIERGELPPPIMVITSNGERRLPDPFLRRCIVHHIELNENLLGRVLNAWSGQVAAGLTLEVQQQALERFLELRKNLKMHTRPPGTAEFLMWLTRLNAHREDGSQLVVDRLNKLPYLNCLIKAREDYEHLK